MANPNFLTIDSYSKDIAAAAAPEDVIADSGAKWKFALDVVIRCPSGNTSDLLIGNRTRQGFSVIKGTEMRLSTVLNRMSQSGKFKLEEIFVKAGTNGDDVEILLIQPSND